MTSIEFCKESFHIKRFHPVRNGRACRNGVGLPMHTFGVSMTLNGRSYRIYSAASPAEKYVQSG